MWLLRPLPSVRDRFGSIRGPPLTYPHRPKVLRGFPPAWICFSRPDLVREHFPAVTEDAVAALHVRRAGWLDAQKLGKWLLAEAQRAGVRLVRDRVRGVTVTDNRVTEVQLQSGDCINTGTFVIAAGPYLKEVGAMVGVDIPVFNELHGKIALRDELGIVPTDTPLLFWSDPIKLPWTDAEREKFAADDETRWLLDEFPFGVHFRSRMDGDTHVLLAIWTYDIEPQPPVWPPTFDPDYPEILIRGLARNDSRSVGVFWSRKPSLRRWWILL